MYKPKLFKYANKNIYELVWFTNYNKKDQELHTKQFNTVKQAESFLNKQKIIC
tara:strand:+ start:3661 stop:3819 length:159 start_codon:yes stop_codon:yes gene_type:complete